MSNLSTQAAALAENAGALAVETLDYSAGDPRAPMVRAVEVSDEPGVFNCETRGPGFFSDSQLRRWADGAGVVLVLMRWKRRT